jgi:hypothetical protein
MGCSPPPPPPYKLLLPLAPPLPPGGFRPNWPGVTPPDPIPKPAKSVGENAGPKTTVVGSGGLLLVDGVASIANFLVV